MTHTTLNGAIIHWVSILFLSILFPTQQQYKFLYRFLITDGWKCNIPKQQASWMKLYMNNTKCKPMIECEVVDPYDSPGSVLADSQCIKVRQLYFRPSSNRN